MPDRAACEKRVYRLAVLLTGDERAAVRVIESVLDAQPDLRAVAGPLVDRLTVLRAREVLTTPARTVAARLGMAGGAAVAAPIPPDVRSAFETLDSLAGQQREAWVLHQVYRLGPRDTARSMDCSLSATRRHLAAAEATMQEVTETPPGDVAATLLHHTLALEVPAVYHVRRRRRRRVRLAVRFALAAAAIGAILVAWWWMRA